MLSMETNIRILPFIHCIHCEFLDERLATRNVKICRLPVLQLEVQVIYVYFTESTCRLKIFTFPATYYLMNIGHNNVF